MSTDILTRHAALTEQLESLLKERECGVMESAITSLRHVPEAASFGDLVPRSEYPQNDWPGQSGRAYYQTTLQDRQDGRYVPVYWYEQDLRIQRAMARWIAPNTSVSTGALQTLYNFVFGKGFTFKCEAEYGVQPPRGLIETVQAVMDDFVDVNDFNGTLDKQLHDGSRIDGEQVVHLKRHGRDVRACVLDSDQLTEPANARGLDDWRQEEDHCDLPRSWSFGVHSLARDASHVFGYHVIYDGAGNDFEYLPASEVVHIKRNVPLSAKRGVSDFLPVSRDICADDKLTRNLGISAAAIASIVGVRKFATGTTGASAGSLLSGKGGDTVTRYTGQGTSRSVQTEPFQGAGILNAGGFDWVNGPLGSRENSALLLVTGLLRRSIGVNWCMPEYLISGDASNGNYSCHDDKTECLTKRGWLPHTEVSESDFVATMNVETGAMEWQQPVAIHRYLHQGDMVRIKARDADLLVTPNHRMIVSAPVYQRVGGRGGAFSQTGELHDWQFCRADEMASKAARVIPTSVKPCGGQREMFFRLPGSFAERNGRNDNTRIDRMLPMDAWLKFLGFWISEGWVSKDGKKRCYALGLCQNVGETAEEIRQCITDLGFHFRTRITESPSGKHLEQFYISDKSLHVWLTENCGCGALNKKLPEFVFDLPADMAEIMLQAMVDGDGSREASGSVVYFTSSPQLANDVQRLGLQLGYVSRRGRQMKNGVYPIGLRTTSGTHRWRRVSRKHVSTETYSGIVWCVSVPNGTAITRRNGVVGITGNSLTVASQAWAEARKTDQRFYGKQCVSMLWKVVRMAFAVGRFDRFGMTWEQIENAIDIIAEGPQINADSYTDVVTQIVGQLDAGLLSKRTAATRLGTDFDHEQENIEQDGDKPPVPPQLAPFSPGPDIAAGGRVGEMKPAQGAQRTPDLTVKSQAGDAKPINQTLAAALQGALESVETTPEARAILTKWRYP